MSNFGLSNYQILSGATYQSANLFLSDPEFGTVEQGKVANLLLINGNPLENLDLIREPEIIFLKGQMINRH